MGLSCRVLFYQYIVLLLIFASPSLEIFSLISIGIFLCSLCWFTLFSITSVACPVYIIHGTRDEVVPFWNGEDLFLATQVSWRAKPFWVDGAGHNNIETLLRHVETLLASLSSSNDYFIEMKGHFLSE